MNGPSVSQTKPVSSPLQLVDLANVRPMALTKPNRLVDSVSPSVPLEKPVTTSMVSPLEPNPFVTIVKTNTPPAAGPFTAPSSNTRLTNFPTKDSAVPLKTPVTTSITSPCSQQPTGLSSSIPRLRVSQPKSAFTPVNITAPANAQPVKAIMNCPSDSQAKPVPSPAPVVNFLTMASTTPCRLFDSLSEGPSVQIEKPVNICTASPSVPQSMCTFMESSTCPEERISKDLSSIYSTLFNSLTKGPSCSLEKPTITSIAIPSNPPLVDLSSLVTSVSLFQPKLTTPPVTFTGPANAPQVNTPLNGSAVSKPKPPPFLVPEVPPMVNIRRRRLLDSLDKDPSVPQKKPVTTSTTSPSIHQSVFTFMNPSTPPAAGPSTASSSCAKLNNSPTKSPSVPLENLVDSIVRSQTPIPPICTVPDFSPTNPDRVPEICLSNLWKYCSLGSRCPDMHYYLPYRWQIHKGTDWEDVPNMEEIEKSYCDPKVDRVPLIEFLTMRSGGHPVPRLSTVSSVMKPSEYVLTTEWLWYWRDEHGSRTQYGQSVRNRVSVTISSSWLENIYLADADAVIPFAAGRQTYELSFRDMKQKNIVYMTERDVRRRPKYLRFDDVKLLKGSTRSAEVKSPLKLGTSPLNLGTPPLKSGPSPMNTDIYPKTWDPEAMPEIGCKKVLVSDTSIEFLEIVMSFSKTVRGHKVKMWRLQNPSLWQVFQWQKEQMKKVNQGRDVKEIQLFHGTDSTYIDAICDQNFDWRICGTHGTSYGQGSYFARDASYSHKFSTPTSSGTRAMFIARVLVGDYVTGNPQMKRPPPRPGSSSQYYDSCVDNVISPSIFVVFEKHQIYPEYLLEYEEEQKNY